MSSDTAKNATLTLLGINDWLTVQFRRTQMIFSGDSIEESPCRTSKVTSGALIGREMTSGRTFHVTLEPKVC